MCVCCLSPCVCLCRLSCYLSCCHTVSVFVCVCDNVSPCYSVKACICVCPVCVCVCVLSGQFLCAMYRESYAVTLLYVDLMLVCVCVCVCERERERERDRDRMRKIEKGRQRELGKKWGER